MEILGTDRHVEIRRPACEGRFSAENNWANSSTVMYRRVAFSPLELGLHD